MDDIHSCSYYCDRPACIKAQRDKLRDEAFDRKRDELKAKMCEVKKPIWVGLTEEEIREIDDTCCYSLSSFVRAVEAKLREKNAYGWQSVENPTQYLDDLRGGDAT